MSTNRAVRVGGFEFEDITRSTDLHLSIYKVWDRWGFAVAEVQFKDGILECDLLNKENTLIYYNDNMVRSSALVNTSTLAPEEEFVYFVEIADKLNEKLIGLREY